MTAPLLDPIGMGLLRELVEAYEAFTVSTSQQWSEANKWVEGWGNTFSREQMDRATAYGALCRDFATHLTFFPVEGIDSDPYHHAEEMTALERQRCAQTIAKQAIALYKHT